MKFLTTLALILSNKTFRFNSLDKMDDLQEKETDDIKNIGQFCYVSSWTEDENESIPMWKMYSSIESGIRIKMQKYPFKEKANLAKDLEECLHKPVIDETNGGKNISTISFKEMIEKGFFTINMNQANMLYKVEYTGEKEKLYPRLVSKDEKSFTIKLGELGKYKNLYWNFQNEWRYIIVCLPIRFENIDYMKEMFQLMANKMLYGAEKQPFPYYDIELDDEAFANMEITMSPRISPGNRVIVQSLIEKYNSHAVVKESSLLGLL